MRSNRPFKKGKKKEEGSHFQYYLPKKDFPNPANLIKKLINEQQLYNIKLWLDKYCEYCKLKEKEEKFDFYTQIKLISTNKKLGIPVKMFDLQSYNQYLERRELLYGSLKKQGYSCEEWVGKVEWRLVIGLGSASVYETSITLHRNYSIPFIPGSAVKGVVRSYASNFNKLNENEIKKIFGDNQQKGKVIFFDALPILHDSDKEKNLLALDVINAHYPSYYNKNELKEGDYPIPNFFLAIEKSTQFKFVIASKKEDAQLAEKAMVLLKEAVEKIGVGAKTSAGYGYFEVKE